MNQKAQKQTIEWPPLLQMMHDEPVIDPTFRNTEKVNAPYLNDMLTPVWVKDTGSVGIYDKDGHRYEINDGWLTRDGAQLFQVSNKKFIKTDITEGMKNYHDYDISDDHEAYTIWDGENNRFLLAIDSTATYTPKLYDEGVLIASRVRIIDDTVWFVAYYDIDDLGYITIVSLDISGNVNVVSKAARWFRHQARRTASDQILYQEYLLENADPIISVGKVANGLTAISLVSSYGKAVNSTRNYFITYFVNEGEVYQLGVDAFPTSETSSVTVANEYSYVFRNSVNIKQSTVRGSCISSDASTYYKYETEGIKGDDLNIPVSYTPSPTGNSVEIDGVTYQIYNYSATLVTATLSMRMSDSSVPFGYTVMKNSSSEEITVEPDTDTPKTVTDSQIVFRGQTPTSGFSELILTYTVNGSNMSQSVNLSSSTIISGSYESVVDSGWLVSPNIALDDGTFAAFWSIPLGYSENNNWASQYLQTGSIIEESGVISSFSIADSQLSYTISPTEYVKLTSDYNVARSNSFIANQNIAISTVKLNNQSATSSYTLYNNGGTAGSESTSSKFLEYSNSNCTDLRYYPGTVRDTNWNYFGDQKFSGDTVVGNAEDQLVFTVQGYRTPVHSADRLLLGSTAVPFNILYNTDTSNTCLPTGISYSNGPNDMGTLLTPWNSVDDSFYIAASHTKCIYKDKSDKYWQIEVVDGNELSALLDDRYLLVNTTSYWNMYDSVLLKKLHFATDYNDRVMFGQTAVPTDIMAGANSSGTVTYSRYTATAINAAYRIMPMLAVSSLLLPYSIRLRVRINAERPFRCLESESSDNQPIDIYYGDVGGTDCKYRYSIWPYYVYDRAIKFDLSDSSYVISSVIYYSPNIFTKFINGAGNNDMAKEDYSTYVLQYYDQIPFFLYSASTETISKNGDDIHFFVLQGQFYAFMNEKIYSVIYSSGAISSQEAIIDCRGMKFVGNNPMIAFFWSPRNRALYSFTGDANLQHIYNANKFSELNDFWYDETTQSIFIATDQGLLVFGPKNTYLFENWKNVTNCQFSNDLVSHITDNGTTWSLKYYPDDEYEALPLDFETSFCGLGANEYTSIDRWDIVLFDSVGDHHATEVTVGVRSMTDITVKCEEKSFKITPDMWDKWSNSVLIRYVPKLQKGQGLRLYLKTPETVQRIVPHIMDMGTGTLTKRGI